MGSIPETVSLHGFCLLPRFLREAERETICDTVSALLDAEDGRLPEPPGASQHRRGGVRHLLERAPSLRALADSEAVRGAVEPILGPSARVVRAILFDKTPAANWLVPWHQDLTIAVRQQLELAGFGPWTRKDGVCHVQPPLSVLQAMLTLRIHLDDCSEDNGALRVIPGSHVHGKLDAEAIRHIVDAHAQIPCALPRGGAMLMRPLLLHASSKAQVPNHRRVIHFEFAAQNLPGGLQWHTDFGADDGTLGNP